MMTLLAKSESVPGLWNSQDGLIHLNVIKRFPWALGLRTTGTELLAVASIINATAPQGCPPDLFLLPVSPVNYSYLLLYAITPSWYKDTPQAVSFTDLIIDFRVWFPINFIFHMHMQLHGMPEL